MQLIIQNETKLTGNIVRDLELKTTEKSTYIRLTIATPTLNGGANFIPCLAYGNTAEYIYRHFIKGKQISIIGRLQTSSYVDKNGEKRYSMDVIIEGVKPQQQEIHPEPNATLETQSDSDLPF